MKSVFPCVFEALEPRVLLSAVVHGHYLQLAGTSGADAIVVEPGPLAGDVVVRGVAGVEDGAVYHGVNRISIIARGGDDSVDIHSGILNTRSQPVGVIIFGGDGNDTLLGGSGNDKIFGGRGDDELSGGGGHDRIQGQVGDDTLTGGVGRDTLIGGGGNDHLDGGADNDVIRGGAGEDMFVGEEGDDKMDGGGGRDTFSAASVTAGVFINLNRSLATGEAIGSNVIRHVENVIASPFVDHIIGNRAANFLMIEANDEVDGGGGTDEIYTVPLPNDEPAPAEPPVTTVPNIPEVQPMRAHEELLREAKSIVLGFTDGLFADEATVQRVMNDLAAIREQFPNMTPSAFTSPLQYDELYLSTYSIKKAGLSVGEIRSGVIAFLEDLGIHLAFEPDASDTSSRMALTEQVNVKQVVDMLRAAGIPWVDVNGTFGYSASIAVQENIYTIRVGWGDCIAGCIYKIYLPYKVTDGHATPLYDAGEVMDYIMRNRMVYSFVRLNDLRPPTTSPIALAPALIDNAIEAWRSAQASS